MSGLLSPALMTKLERLQLASVRRLVGASAGGHRSTRFGSSLDFADYREYQPGDDLRRIDLFAAVRLDRLLIRLFEAEEDIVIRILIDTSASMAGPKLDRAKEVAAAIGFLALRNRDVVEIHTISSDTQQQFRGRRFGAPSALVELFNHLANLTAAGTTPFANAVGSLLQQGGSPGLTVLLSDILTEDWESGIRHLPARGSELMAIHIMDPADYRPEIYGDLELIDRETGSRLDVSISAKVIEQYTEAAETWRDGVARQIRSVGGTYAPCQLDESLEAFLFETWLGTGAIR